MRTNKPTYFISTVIILLAMTLGCSADGEGPMSSMQGTSTPTNQTPPTTPRENVAPPASTTTARTTEGEAAAAAPLWAPEPKTRVRKRLNVDQLGAALWAATDGLKWAQDDDDDLLATLSLTLGKPDYVEVTTENLDSNVLFMKFLEDAAGSVCRQMVERDVAENTNLLIAQEGEDATHMLRLLSKFHSRDLTTTHPDVKQWQWLFDSALTISQDAHSAWHTVCVALIRHPDFYSY